MPTPRHTYIRPEMDHFGDLCSIMQPLRTGQTDSSTPNRKTVANHRHVPMSIRTKTWGHKIHGAKRCGPNFVGTKRCSCNGGGRLGLTH